MTGRSPVRGSTSPELLLSGLLAEQRRRFAELDPGLPEAPAPPPGDVVVAGTRGQEGAGVVTTHVWPAGSAPLLWSATEVTELHPVLGPGAAGMHALVAAWREGVPARLRRTADSAATVCWPSRDVYATRVLLDHGLAPLAVLAVRPSGAGTSAPPHRRAAPPPDPAGGGLAVRRAGPPDLEACLRLGLEELAYSSLVGGAVVRPDAEAIKRAALRDRLRRGDPVWLAERGGTAVGMLEGGVADAVPGTWLGGLLPPGRWGYVNCASVVPGHRGAGVGRALASAALPALDDGARGTYLYYNPPNPLSSVFWPRLGYRPLWTLWETRPVSSLR